MFEMVPEARVELAHLSITVFETAASANSATRAKQILRIITKYLCIN